MSFVSSSRWLFIALLGTLGAGCLEANAATAGGDGGADGKATTQDTGTTTFDVATGVDVHVSTPDSTMGTPDTPATVTIPQCMDPTPTLTACAACDQTMCQPDVAAAVGACTSFYTCYQACDCSDTTCVGNCIMAAGSGCDTAAGALAGCQKASCAAACAVPDAGSGSGSSSGSGSGSGGSTCKNPTATQTACASCEESKCASTVSSVGSSCPSSFDTCFDACDCSDTSCIETCAEAAGSTCQSALEALEQCQTGTCASTCSGGASDGGAAKDASSGGALPLCTGATQEIVTCTQCDNTSCASTVSAAVAACTAYYACYSTTSCETALEACAADSTAECDTAAEALDACQTEMCFSSCG